MKKPIYSPPEITVVDFKVEHCFDSVTGVAGAASNRTFLSRWLEDISGEQQSSSTGEYYSAYTDDRGEYYSGGWD